MKKITVCEAVELTKEILSVYWPIGIYTRVTPSGNHENVVMTSVSNEFLKNYREVPECTSIESSKDGLVELIELKEDDVLVLRECSFGIGFDMIPPNEFYDDYKSVMTL